MMAPMMKPIPMYTNAMRNNGPRAEIFCGVKAGTIFAKTSNGRDMFIVTCDAPFEAAGGNNPLRARIYPQRIDRYL